MNVHRIPSGCSVEEAAAWAEKCFKEKKDRLLKDPRVLNDLGELDHAARASSEAMEEAGVKDLCRECEEEEGGSCCARGLEKRYDPVLLLINLLLGVRLPKARCMENSCFFLGKRGCLLRARQVICVNYLCDKIVRNVPGDRISDLREREGRELELLHRLHGRIVEILRDEEGTAGSLAHTVRFFDERKVGDAGALGFRRSTPLKILAESLDGLFRGKIIVPGETRFLDMGCADGRVNILMSYHCRVSVGVEIDEWTLEEYGALRKELDKSLFSLGLPLPPDNIHLFHGDTTDEKVQETVFQEVKLGLEDFDLFFTYLTMYEEFGELIARKGARGAVFMVYGLDVVLPKLPGFTLLQGILPAERKLVLYRKD